jgi:hypothetical protein
MEPDDSLPLLADDRTCGCGRDAAARGATEPIVTRLRRVFSPRRMCSKAEVAGSLGDLGTFLSDIVALSNGPHGRYPAPASFVFFSGIWSVFAGVVYDIPIPVQPMHTVVAVSLTEGLSYPEIVCSGLWLGLFFLVLGATGLVGVLRRAIPLPVVRGLQLGLGLKLVGTGLAMLRSSSWIDTSHNLNGHLLGSLSVAIALLCYQQTKVPASLVLFVLGCLGAAWSRPALTLGLQLPTQPPPAISADAAWRALYRAALPQLPVTLLNAVVSTAKLSEDLYPRRPASVRKLSISIAAMNLSCCLWGAFPSCHGCGGLAAQHAFGARTGSSLAMIGLCKALTAVALGPSLLAAFEAFPSSVLGVLLAVSGVELAACCRDMRTKPEAAVMLVGAGCGLQLGTGIGFLAAAAAAAAFWCSAPPWRGHRSEHEDSCPAAGRAEPYESEGQGQAAEACAGDMTEDGDHAPVRSEATKPTRDGGAREFIETEA